MNDFIRGLKNGIPIALGYFAVSFTFGIKAVNTGLPIWMCVLISISNLASAGQFAGITMIFSHCSYIEVALTTLVINIRYALMSLAFSQKLSKQRFFHRFLYGNALTDEIFAVSIAHEKEIKPLYMYGIMILPIIGWSLGTGLGAFASNIMPEYVSKAMELGLYAMFIAIIVPPARKEKSVLVVILIAVLLSVIMYYIPFFSFISVGFQVVIATIIAAAIGAVLFPIKNEEEENEV